MTQTTQSHPSDLVQSLSTTQQELASLLETLRNTLEKAKQIQDDVTWKYTSKQIKQLESRIQNKLVYFEKCQTSLEQQRLKQKQRKRQRKKAS
jgi:hypothetical protein